MPARGEPWTESSARPVIIISGFMGTGKTAAGKVLANLLALEFIDTDTEIENSTGLSIPAIFDAHGEAHFRKLEESLCLSLEDTHGVVIATGGGTLLNESIFEMFSRIGQLVLLETSADVLSLRITENDTRPLFFTQSDADLETPIETRIKTLLESRSHVYDRIGIRIDTSRLKPAEAAAQIAAAIDIPCQSAELSLIPTGARTDGRDPESILRGRGGTAHIDIGRGVLSTLGDRLESFGINSRVFLLIPDNVRELYLGQLTASLEHVSIPFSVIPVNDGDSSKNLAQAEYIIDKLIAQGARRDATIVPVGGGVTGDLGGFVASLFMRGIPLVHVPTTLLAQVDSGIGGKVGVNHPLSKNLIGSFYQPHVVLIDPCTLRTLPTVEISNGMAEVVKSALIGSASLFAFLEKHMSDDPGVRLRDIDFLEACVTESARIKIRIVNQDPFENNLRRSLNLGHTVGHAIEASTHYNGIRHGEAVSLGMIAALRIAVNRSHIGRDLLDRTLALLKWCGLPVRLERFERESVRESIRLDKKIKKGKIHYVLPTGLGNTVVTDDISEEEILSTLEKGAP